MKEKGRLINVGGKFLIRMNAVKISRQLNKKIGILKSRGPLFLICQTISFEKPQILILSWLV